MCGRLTGGRWRNIIPASLLTLGSLLTTNNLPGLRSTYICPLTASYPTVIPQLQVAGTILDVVLMLMVDRLVSRGRVLKGIAPVNRLADPGWAALVRLVLSFLYIAVPETDRATLAGSLCNLRTGWSSFLPLLADQPLLVHENACSLCRKRGQGSDNFRPHESLCASDGMYDDSILESNVLTWQRIVGLVCYAQRLSLLSLRQIPPRSAQLEFCLPPSCQLSLWQYCVH